MPNINPKTYDSVPSRKVAFLGLGVMGHPMAGHLARAGHQVTVYNRTAAKAEAWAKEYGGAFAATPAAAASALTSFAAALGKCFDISLLLVLCPERLAQLRVRAGVSAGDLF